MKKVLFIFGLLCMTLFVQQLSKISAQSQAAVPEGFVQINGGTFTIGSPASETGRGSNEIQRQVTVSGFYMGRHQVTQSEYEEVMGTNPSSFR